MSFKAVLASISAPTLLVAAYYGAAGGLTMQANVTDYRGAAFVSLGDPAGFERAVQLDGTVVLTSPEATSPIAAKEIIVSWNGNCPPGTGIKVEARAIRGDHYTRYYVLGLWSSDDKAYPRESIAGQKDADGDVATDTLQLSQPGSRFQVRVSLEPEILAPQATVNAPPTPLTPPALPTTPVQAPLPPTSRVASVRFVGVSLSDTSAAPALPPIKAVWGTEVAVPSKSQLEWPGGGGWCSPTSTGMALAYWSGKLHRPELDLTVPDIAHAVNDRVYGGTGNWPFNTAFAGSFPGIRAYVTRFTDVSELEEWIAAGYPVVVSVSYDLLKGQQRDNDPGHLMVCAGFEPNGDIVLNDPAHHPERGEHARRVFSRANFIRAWNRSRFTVYLIYPEGSVLPHDQFGHWADTEIRKSVTSSTQH